MAVMNIPQGIAARQHGFGIDDLILLLWFDVGERLPLTLKANFWPSDNVHSNCIGI